MNEVLEHSAEASSKGPNKSWSVRDKNARESGPGNEILPRKHEILPGVIYALYFHRDTPMPEAHARRFLKDGSFEVFDHDGALVPPLSEQAMTRTAPKVLSPKEVIATLDELSHTSLVTRASILVTGNDPVKINTKTSRDALIEFIQMRNAELQATEGDDDAAAENMTSVELKRMFD
jgi:hypothetical protein